MRRIYALNLIGTAAGGSLSYFLYATAGFYASGYPGPGGARFADGRVVSAGVLSEHAFGRGTLHGDMEVPSLALVLTNHEGELDELLDYSFSTGLTVLYAIDPETFVFSGTPFVGEQKTMIPEQPVYDQETITLALRNYRANLLRPLLTTKYAGTNTGAPLAGIEGTAEDIKGQPKPVVLGTVFNITPQLVNTSRYIYQVDRRGLLTGYTISVYDKRSALTRGADYASQADMETNAPAAGQYRVWVSGGCFRVGTVPVGAITCDVSNPVTAGGAITLLNVINGIIQHIGAVSVGASQFLTYNEECGIYLDREMTCMEACNAVLSGVNAYLLWGGDPTDAGSGGQGVPQVMQITPPGSLPYAAALDALELNESNIERGSIQQVVPNDGANGLPVWRVNLNYKRNYTVMSAGELAGVAATDIAFCEREYRTVTVDDASVKTQWADAVELNINSLLVDATDAQNEATRILGCYKVRRQTIRLKVSGEAVRAHPQLTASGATRVIADFQVGCRVRITLDRFGWDAGKLFLVIGMDLNLDTDMYDLTLWG